MTVVARNFKPMDKKPRLIRIVSAVILACGLTVTVLLAQDDIDRNPLVLNGSRAGQRRSAA